MEETYDDDPTLRRLLDGEMMAFFRVLGHVAGRAR
jgi:hypothetical protein